MVKRTRGFIKKDDKIKAFSKENTDGWSTQENKIIIESMNCIITREN